MGSAAFDASNLISLGFDTANEEYIDNVKKQVATNIEASDSMENAMELAS
jgi:methanogenic corrinoid protein MtbC1